MERFEAEEVFTALKPLCDSLANEPNIHNAKHLAQIIERRSGASIQFYFEYVLFPIYVHLNNEKLSTDVRQQLVELLRTVLSKTTINKFNSFLKLYTALLKQIYDGNQPTMLITSHEELKESTVKCLNDLIGHCSTDVIESLYARENAAKISQGVYICLSIAKTEKLGSLRLAAIETLMTLSQVHDDADQSDIVLRAQVAEIMMLFLPGIAHGLHEVAIGNDLQSHKITIMAIRAFGRILALIMEDKIQEENINVDSVHNNEIDKSLDPLGTLLKSEGDKGMKKYIQTATRSQEWLDAASTKLNALIRSLINLARHSHFQVRKELVITVKLMLCKCSRNMMKNFMEFVEILIALSEDEVDQVKELARTTLNEINEKFTANYRMRPVVESLEENFYKLLTKLPRLIRRSDDSIQLSYLNQLAGYIRLLGKQRLPHVMTSVSHLRRLLLALVYVAELDCSHVSILEDVQAKDIEETTYNHLHSWKNFKFIREKSIEEKLTSICKLLGDLGDVELLVDSIFDLMSEMPQYQKELTLLLNWISTVPAKDSSTLALHGQIIDYYTRPDNWYLPIEVGEDVSLGDAQSNIIHCCLLIEGLGNIAKTLQEGYQIYLLKTLYFVIERAGSGNSFISHAGLKSLEQIAISQKHNNVAELLRDNVDYVSYHVTMKMRRVERNPGVLDVFSVVMKYSTMDVLPCLNAVVEDALAQLSVNYHQKYSYALLKMLYIFAVRIRKLSTTVPHDDEKRNVNAFKSQAETVILSLLEYSNAKRDSELIENDDICTTSEDIESDLNDGTADEFSAYDNQEDEETAKPPPYIKMTVDIMKCCLHFLPSKEIPKSLLAMQILDEGLDILSKWSDQLLPIVHQLWHPLVDRFQDSNILVINRAWQLLYTLAHVSEDFIRSRTLKQVLPALSQFLTKSAKESYGKDTKNAYKFTQMYKLQKLLLTQAGTVARNLKLQERQLWQMLDITQPYLNIHQHPTLQDSCVQFFKDVALCNADIVWVKCLSIWNCHVTPIPTNHNVTLENLKALSIGSSDNYRTNVEIILTYVEGMNAADV